MSGNIYLIGENALHDEIWGDTENDAQRMHQFLSPVYCLHLFWFQNVGCPQHICRQDTFWNQNKL